LFFVIQYATPKSHVLVFIEGRLIQSNISSSGGY